MSSDKPIEQSRREAGKRSRAVQQKDRWEGIYQRTAAPDIKEKYRKEMRELKEIEWTYKRLCRDQM